MAEDIMLLNNEQQWLENQDEIATYQSLLEQPDLDAEMREVFTKIIAELNAVQSSLLTHDEKLSLESKFKDFPHELKEQTKLHALAEAGFAYQKFKAVTDNQEPDKKITGWYWGIGILLLLSVVLFFTKNNYPSSPKATSDSSTDLDNIIAMAFTPQIDRMLDKYQQDRLANIPMLQTPQPQPDNNDNLPPITKSTTSSLQNYALVVVKNLDDPGLDSSFYILKTPITIGNYNIYANERKQRPLSGNSNDYALLTYREANFYILWWHEKQENKGVVLQLPTTKQLSHALNSNKGVQGAGPKMEWALAEHGTGAKLLQTAPGTEGEAPRVSFRAPQNKERACFRLVKPLSKQVIPTNSQKIN